MARKYFKSKSGNIPLPVFFPDATRAVLKTIDSTDLINTKTEGVLINTFHLYRELDKNILDRFGGIRNFMSWEKGIISDSGGFQVMSIIKRNNANGTISDKGIHIKLSRKKTITFTPEESIRFQFKLKPDMMVVLDDFTDPFASYSLAKESVERTLIWALRCRKEYERLIKKAGYTNTDRPYLLGVVQGGKYPFLRKYCTKKLVAIGFDGLGYGGWPINENRKFDYISAKIIAENSPTNYFLYGLGIGKPEEIVKCTKLGFNIFDCVLPTRDARHKRLYVFNAETKKDINVNKDNFYSYYIPDKNIYSNDKNPISKICDCLLCKNYSRAYLYHLFKIKDTGSMRLSTIHNLRFYSILMEKLKQR